MYDRKMRYLKERAMRRNESRNGRRYDDEDYRDYRGDYRRDYRPMNDYRRDYRDDYRDYRNDYRDYRDYASDDYDKDYEKDLKKWTEKLKRYDRFGLNEEQIIKKASEMGVQFKDYNEDEFYAIYLMHISDYPTVANEPHTYLGMAKSWLEDKDLSIEPSEKVCKYMYEIVMADEE